MISQTWSDLHGHHHRHPNHNDSDNDDDDDHYDHNDYVASAQELRNVTQKTCFEKKGADTGDQEYWQMIKLHQNSPQQ